MPDYEFYCTECDAFWSVFMKMEDYEEDKKKAYEDKVKKAREQVK